MPQTLLWLMSCIYSGVWFHSAIWGQRGDGCQETWRRDWLTSSLSLSVVLNWGLHPVTPCGASTESTSCVRHIYNTSIHSRGSLFTVVLRVQLSYLSADLPSYACFLHLNKQQRHNWWRPDDWNTTKLIPSFVWYNTFMKILNFLPS